MMDSLLSIPGASAKQMERYTASLKVKRLLVFLNLLTIFLAPIAYIPLAKIQVAYVNKCFLYTEIQVDHTGVNNDTTVSHHREYQFRFSSEKSVWGSEKICHYVTYGLVSTQIISIITFWIIIHLWGEMMSIGNGGAMAVILSVIYLSTTINLYMSNTMYTEGFHVWCASIAKIETSYKKLSCETWGKEIKFEEIEGMEVMHFMYLAQSILLSLIMVEAFKVLNCLSVAFVTHYKFRPSEVSVSF